MIANKCSAADAECLKQIREAGSYSQLNLTWEDFCQDHLHISRSHADRLIGISTSTYRQIQPHVMQGKFEEGEMIDICLENAGKIYNAVDGLRRQAADARAQLSRTNAALRLTRRRARPPRSQSPEVRRLDDRTRQRRHLRPPAESCDEVRRILDYVTAALDRLPARIPPQFKSVPDPLTAPPKPRNSAREKARR